ncbi:MAG: CRTAC1 family protein [Deltaproteobacteria bacterium]|nr:CRTAC1 family protein [Deltaproteobacteria bacterium]
MRGIRSGGLLVLSLLGVGCTRPREPSPAARPATPAPAATPTPAPADGATLARDRVARMVDQVSHDTSLARVNAEEAILGEVRRTLLTPWITQWKARQGAGFSAHADAGLSWSTGARTLRRELDGLREFTWAPQPTAAPGEEAQQYLAAFSRVDDVRLDVWRMVPAGERVTLDVRYELRGVTTAGARRHDRGALTLEATKREGAWRVTRATAAGMESVEAARRPTFEVATASMGLDRLPIASRTEAIRRGGYAIAVADYDGDQRPDVLVGNVGPVQLLRNTGHGFEDVTRAAGLQGETLVKSAVFADLDSDGLRDLVLLRFVDSTDRQSDDLSIYRNLGGGRFERHESVLPRGRRYDRGMPLAVADFDGNGHLDLYLGFPGARDFTNNLQNGQRTAGLSSQGLWFNQGNWRFTESPADSVLVQAREVYPHATLVSDLDRDGRVDLLVVDDSGRVSPVYHNDGNGRFHDVTVQSGLSAPGWSMGAAAGDFDGDGAMDLVTTNVALLDSTRMAASAEGREADPELARRFADLRRSQTGTLLYHNRGDGTFEEVGQRSGIDWVGEGAAGAEWIDYNSDGRLDLYVANGLWSGGEEDFSSLFTRATLLGRNSGEWEAGDEVTGVPVFAARGREPNPILTILREFRGGLGNPLAPWTATAPTLSMAGSQRNRLYRNNGDGSFTEVGYLEGADAQEDGYVIAPADIDADGRQDLVLRNCDPAPGRRYETVSVLHNVGASGHSLRVSARGESNSDGFGATVTVWVGDRRIVREIRAVSGAAQGEPGAFIGLGTAQRADRVEIRWPDGRVQNLGSVPAGPLVMRERAAAAHVAAR